MTSYERLVMAMGLPGWSLYERTSPGDLFVWVAPVTTTYVVECWGRGGEGHAGADGVGGMGGGGGAYARAACDLVAGQEVQVWISPHPDPTSFGAYVVAAKGKAGGDRSGDGIGGQAADCTGDVCYSGGDGAAGDALSGGGGGGAAGPSGDGNNAAGPAGGVALESGGGGGAGSEGAAAGGLGLACGGGGGGGGPTGGAGYGYCGRVRITW